MLLTEHPMFAALKFCIITAVLTGGTLSGGPMNASYTFDNIRIHYEVPVELQAGYTRAHQRFDGYGPTGVASIYYTAWSRQRFLSEQPIGNLTLAVIECPKELRGALSLESMEGYYRKARETDANALGVSIVSGENGQWLAIEEYARSDVRKIRSVSYYRPIGEHAVLFLGLGSLPSEYWPQDLLRKLRPALADMLKSVTVAEPRESGR